MTFDFDFLDGEWTIQHHRLKERMVGSDEWNTFETRYEAWQLLGGAASVDKVFGLVDGKPFEGVSVRTYDKETGDWETNWIMEFRKNSG